MSDTVLVIGNKNYSSWSLRPWLLMKVKGVAFDEIRVPLYQRDSKAAIEAHAPAGRARYGKVPILHDGELIVWDSLAICEYVAERWPGTRCWPTDVAQRAHARAISAEMHAGFRTLRSDMPMNCRRTPSPIEQSPELRTDIERVLEIWTGALAASGGPFLFGDFTIADAMYAPVVLRFVLYAVELPAPARRYADAVLALPPLQAWMAAGRAERDVLSHFDK